MSLITKGQSCAMVCQYTATRCLGSFKATRAQVVVRLAFSSMTNNSTGSSRKIHSIQPAIHSIRKCDQTILKIRSIGSHTKRSHKHHSTSTMDFVHSYPSVIVTDPHNIPRPSSSALRTLFIASAVPMVGFGCMDNFVMIQAGQYIDSTLGVQLGLATMAAAAAGQVVSDVSGVVFGGTLERIMTRLSLIKTPPLTMEQRQLPLARNVSMAGAVLGVIVGCALGATTLLLVDLEARDRIQRAVHLRDVVTDMIRMANDSDDNLQSAGGFRSSVCANCIVYVDDDANDITLTKLSASSHDEVNVYSTSATTLLKPLKDAQCEEVKSCAESRRAIVCTDRQNLYIPIVKRPKVHPDGEGEVMAILAFQSSSQNTFNDSDVASAKVMARHIAIFMERLTE